MTPARLTWQVCAAALMVLPSSSCGIAFHYPEPEAERGATACGDGLDNDVDGKVDCDDLDCVGTCPEEDAAACSDSQDNDADGLTDAADPRCWFHFPPQTKRCASALGIDLAKGFDALDYGTATSTWGGGPGASALRSATDARRDPVLALSRPATQADVEPDNLADHLGALWHNSAFSGVWEGFELSFVAAVPAQAILRAGIVPLPDAPSLASARTPPDEASSLVSIALDRAASPARLIVRVGPEERSAALPDGAPCDQGDSGICAEEFSLVRLSLEDDELVGSIQRADGSSVEVHAPSPESSNLLPARLVLWGGAVDVAERPVLDDLRLKVSPEWPCGYAVPQITGEYCGASEAPPMSGHQVSVGGSLDGSYCALVTRSPSALEAVDRFDAWESSDGKDWTAASSPQAPALELPSNSAPLSAGISADEDGWHVAALFRKDGVIQLGFADGEECGSWGRVADGPTLFEDAEGPSYVISGGQHLVYFTRPATDETGRTLWRVARSGLPPELLTELPTDVGAPVSVTAAGERDLVLAYPVAPDFGTGAGLLVGETRLRHWERVEPSPILRLPDRLGGHEGRIAFDDRGMGAVSIVWGSEGGFLLYSGQSASASALEASTRWTVGTADLHPAGVPFPSEAVVPEDSCKGGRCAGPAVLTQPLAEDWEVVSQAAEPALGQYFVQSPPAWAFRGGEPTWSVQELDAPLTGDFELGFDVQIDPLGLWSPDCSVYVGLATPPGPTFGEDAADAASATGLFVRLAGACSGRYSATPLALIETRAFEDPLPYDPEYCLTEDTFAGQTRQHVVLRNQGDQLTVLLPLPDGCGTVERSISYPVGALPGLPALLLGWGGSAFATCGFATGVGLLENLVLRLLHEPKACPAEMRLCETALGDPICIDVSRNSEHCGACDSGCSAHEICEEGKCSCNAAAGFLTCDGVCVDPLHSPDHCGECDHACPAQCDLGVCGVPLGCDQPLRLPAAGGTFPFVVPAGGTTVPAAWACDAGGLGGDLVVLTVVSWTPASSGDAVLEVVADEYGYDVDSYFDPVLGVRVGAASPDCSEWDECRDETDEFGKNARSIISVEAGTTYSIGVGARDAPLATAHAELRIRLE